MVLVEEVVGPGTEMQRRSRTLLLCWLLRLITNYVVESQWSQFHILEGGLGHGSRFLT